nr:zinc finger protein with KRAB and SCAN domains 7-like [Aedes albopictus]XP_029723543.1 zinc finger protein with KRAB and SCAN domains 7-like [Aedes albopictus]XP_029723544.1 zinc finger protein with KRAB and SCAN domains 7-like [Aedes albopictus]XP_029723545.1 zinc finger protein with KRAB and SCAN domains 7-like [Aedes albopictus]XP_029723546.1 zinc finger protein with KRAB and SCAN domains 7-like [Aedes albopictus]
MEDSAVSEIAEPESNADQRDLQFELGLGNAEIATSRSNDSMYSKMEDVCEVPKDNVISDETNVRRQGSVKANSEGKTKSPREKPNHRCDQCLKVFSTSLKLKDHMRMVQGEKKYACHICDKRFVLPNNLRVHARSHNEDTPFKCNVCQKTFKYEQSVWQHKKTQHVSQNSCVDCGIDFPSRRQYEQHLRTILHRINAEMRGNSQNERVSDESGSNGTTDETPQRMDEIEKVGEAQPETAETAQQQQQKHHQCDNCPKKFLEKRQLKTHKRFTHGEKKFVCPVCAKGYIAACYLRVHMRVHDPAKSFKCTKCEKWYKDIKGPRVPRKNQA